jgi:hypothetical protein
MLIIRAFRDSGTIDTPEKVIFRGATGSTLNSGTCVRQDTAKNLSITLPELCSCYEAVFVSCSLLSVWGTFFWIFIRKVGVTAH